jgi:uncharacterized membrane protein
MTKERLLGFTDGVIAVIITIMVLELEAPEGAEWAALRPQMPVFFSYLMSFLYIAIYWVNHHHMFQAVEGITGGVLWANIHLLFWMSITPFVTAWMGATHFATVPVASYGVLQIMNALSYLILSRALIRCHGENSTFTRALGSDLKGKLSLASYLLAFPVAFVRPWLSLAIFWAVGVMWLVPDQRFERALSAPASSRR